MGTIRVLPEELHAAAESFRTVGAEIPQLVGMVRATGDADAGDGRTDAAIAEVTSTLTRALVGLASSIDSDADALDAAARDYVTVDSTAMVAGH